MSYMSGLMLGVSFGKQIHNFFTDKKLDEGLSVKKQAFFELVHELPTRRRYRVSLLIGNENLALLLEEKLSKLNFIHNVEANANTGSIVFSYAEEDSVQIEAVVEFLKARIFPIQKNTNEYTSTAPESVKNLSETFRLLSQKIREKTANVFDLNSLASFIFIIRGIRKILLYGQAPSGPQMLWWAFSLLRGWRLV